MRPKLNLTRFSSNKPASRRLSEQRRSQKNLLQTPI